MTLRRQLSLDLGHLPALGREDFLAAPANHAAVAWIERWPDWPAAGLVLEGPAGAGKSHLAAVWRGRSGAGLVNGGELTAEAVPVLAGGTAALVVEAADAAPEPPLLHLYNAMAERGGHLLLTARTPPGRWPLRLPDLRSRLAALPVASIGLPDEDLMRALLVKLFADRQTIVGAEVVEYLALRLERSFDAAGRAVAALDAAALARRGPITVPLARQVLEAG